jgi:hypothetical protein
MGGVLLLQQAGTISVTPVLERMHGAVHNILNPVLYCMMLDRYTEWYQHEDNSYALSERG